MLTRHSVIGILILVFSSLTCQVFALETDVDARLEKQLDHYIELIQTDMPAGEVLIAKLTNSEINNPALQSRARLLGYLTTNAFYDKKPDLSEHFLRQLLAIVQQTDNPNTLSEIYATELELLIYKQKSKRLF